MILINISMNITEINTGSHCPIQPEARQTNLGKFESELLVLGTRKMHFYSSDNADLV